MGGGGSKQPKIPLGREFGRGVKFHIYFLEGGGVRATWKPLWLHPWHGPLYYRPILMLRISPHTTCKIVHNFLTGMIF